MEAELKARTDELVDLALDIRRRKDGEFGEALAADPGWELLLQLYAARLRDKSVRLEQFEGEFPLSALARWVRLLEEQGLVEWSSGRSIGSAHAIQLTRLCALKMSRVFESPAERSLPV